MDKRPVSYLQTDPRWSDKDYSAKGETTTIGRSGCGPTAMAMVLATWADPNVTPETECAWALAHGWKAPHQGTYYGYFPRAAERYGLVCCRLNAASIYGMADAPYHAQAAQALDRGCLVIACMGKGTWTRSGHYVLCYRLKGDTIYINDPASTKDVRTRGDYATFRRQVKYYWVIDPPKKEDEDMDIDKLLKEMTDAQAAQLLEKAMRHYATVPEPEWSRDEGWWAKAHMLGLVNGEAPERPVRRDEFVAVLGRKGLI